MSIIFGYHYQTIAYTLGAPTTQTTEVECLDEEVVMYRDLLIRLEKAFLSDAVLSDTDVLEIADLKITRPTPSMFSRSNIQTRQTNFIVKRNSQYLNLSYFRVNQDFFKLHYVNKYFVVSASSQNALDILLPMISMFV